LSGGRREKGKGRKGEEAKLLLSDFLKTAPKEKRKGRERKRTLKRATSTESRISSWIQSLSEGKRGPEEKQKS